MEVIVGVLLIATVYVGLLAAFVSVRRYINRANKRLITANLARSIYEQMYNKVRMDNWNNPLNDLYAVNGSNWTQHNRAPFVVDGKQYTPSWQVRNSPLGYDYREVKVTIQYSDT